MHVFTSLRKYIFISKRSASRAEIILLGLTLLCLPMFEAPKNIFSILFLITWLIQSFRVKSLGDNCIFDWFIGGLSVILWVAPFFSDYGHTITALGSAPRWTLLALFVICSARLNYSDAQLKIVWLALLVGGIMAVLESFWVWHSNGRPYPELRSVGHVNHSAMYILVVLAAAFPALFTKLWSLILVGAAAVVVMVLYLPPAKSGVAFLTTVALLTSYVILLSFPRLGWKYSLIGAAVALVLSFCCAALFGSGMWDEFVHRLASTNVTNGRLQYARIALEVFDRHPLIGTGWHSFSLATSEEILREEVAQSGRLVDFNYAGQPHGHNLWSTLLVERGLFGVTLVTILLILYFATFLPIALGSDHVDPIARCVAVGAVLVTVSFTVGGLGNTTMMNEHGHAGMAFNAVAYGYLRGRGILPSKSG